MNKKRIIIYGIVALTLVAVLLASKLPADKPDSDRELTLQTESVEDQIEDMDTNQSFTSSEHE